MTEATPPLISACRPSSSEWGLVQTKAKTSRPLLDRNRLVMLQGGSESAA